MSSNQNCSLNTPNPDSQGHSSRNESSPSSCPYYNDQLRMQDSFWRTTIQDLKRHIQSLQKQKDFTEYSINTLESTLLPCMTYLMIQLSSTNPNLNLNELLSSEIKDCCSNPCLYKDVPVPDLSMLESFTIQDNDVLYIDMIKAYAEEAAQLKSSIDNLVAQEKALLNTKERIDAMFHSIGSSDSEKFVINGQLVKDLHERLINYKAELRNNIAAEKIKSCELKREFCEMRKQIAAEEKREKELRSEVDYAGANIDITNILTMAETIGEFDGKTIEDYQQEMSDLNGRYTQLQSEWKSLSKEAEELRNDYKKKKLEETAVRKFDFDFVICDDAHGSIVCDCNQSETK